MCPIFRRSVHLPFETSALSMAYQTRRTVTSARWKASLNPQALRGRLRALPASLDEIERYEFPHASRRIAAWESGNVVPISRSLHAHPIQDLWVFRARTTCLTGT